MDERMPWRDRLTAMDPRQGWRKWGFSRQHWKIEAQRTTIPATEGSLFTWRNHGTLGAAGDVVLARRVEVQVSPAGDRLYQKDRDRFGVDSETLEPLEVPPWERK